MKKKSETRVNRALKNLEILVGDWDMELSRASFLPDRQAKIRGPASCKWVENGSFLAVYQGNKRAPQARWLIGADESAELYKILYFDARGVSRVYEMSFKGGEWKMWRNSPGFSQRFISVVSKHGNSIKGTWEKSTDGKTWEHDFDVLYTRLMAKSRRDSVRDR